MGTNQEFLRSSPVFAEIDEYWPCLSRPSSLFHFCCGDAPRTVHRLPDPWGGNFLTRSVCIARGINFQ